MYGDNIIYVQMVMDAVIPTEETLELGIEPDQHQLNVSLHGSVRRKAGLSTWKKERV